MKARAHWKCLRCRKAFATVGDLRKAGPCPNCGAAIPADQLAELADALEASTAQFVREEEELVAKATPVELDAMELGAQAYQVATMSLRPPTIGDAAHASPFTRGKLRTPANDPTDPRHAFFMRGWRIEEARDRAEGGSES